MTGILHINDIKGLIEFYESPLGHRLVEVQPRVKAIDVGWI